MRHYGRLCEWNSNRKLILLSAGAGTFAMFVIVDSCSYLLFGLVIPGYKVSWKSWLFLCSLLQTPSLKEGTQVNRLVRTRLRFKRLDPWDEMNCHYLNISLNTSQLTSHPLHLWSMESLKLTENTEHAGTLIPDEPVSSCSQHLYHQILSSICVHKKRWLRVPTHRELENICFAWQLKTRL